MRCFRGCTTICSTWQATDAMEAQQATEAKKAKRGGAGRVGAKKLDMHRFMTDEAYMIEQIGGQAVFDAFAKEMEAVIGTALDTEETE